MAQLYFRYGCMGSSKSLNLLATAHNYKSLGKNVLLLKPNLDTRSTNGYIESRAGLKAECVDITSEDNLLELYKNKDIVMNDRIEAILVDEANFLTKEQVKQLRKIVDKFNIPVMAFGLKNSYIDSKLFEGSKALLYYADKIEEIKTICSCSDCNKKATMNLRVLNGKPVYDGEMINCGDTKPNSDYYISVCSNHYYNPIGINNLK